MTIEEREALYDAEIAPKLADVGRICEANGISLVAFCEWAPGESGTTMTYPENSGIATRVTVMAVNARGNVDALLMALDRYAEKHGPGNSMEMRLRQQARQRGRREAG